MGDGRRGCAGSLVFLRLESVLRLVSVLRLESVLRLVSVLRLESVLRLSRKRLRFVLLGSGGCLLRY